MHLNCKFQWNISHGQTQKRLSLDRSFERTKFAFQYFHFGICSMSTSWLIIIPVLLLHIPANMFSPVKPRVSLSSSRSNSLNAIGSPSESPNVSTSLSLCLSVLCVYSTIITSFIWCMHVSHINRSSSKEFNAAGASSVSEASIFSFLI